jgi:hypothetical protein
MASQDIYILRLWHEASEPEAWRVTLTDAKSQEKKYFASLETLIAFFREKLELESEGVPSLEGLAEERKSR